MNQGIFGFPRRAPAVVFAESSPLAYVSGATSYSFAHGLGVTPQNHWAVLRCTAAEFGYAIGDEIVISDVNAINGNSRGGFTWASPTTVGMEQIAAIYISRRDTAGAIPATVGFWAIILRAVRYG